MITVLPGLVNQKEENSKNSLERRSSIPVVPEVQTQNLLTSATTVQNDTPQNTNNIAQIKNSSTAPIPTSGNGQNVNETRLTAVKSDIETSTPQNQTYTKPEFIDQFQSRFNLLEQTFKEIQVIPRKSLRKTVRTSLIFRLNWLQKLQANTGI